MIENGLIEEVENLRRKYNFPTEGKDLDIKKLLYFKKTYKRRNDRKNKTRK